VANDNSPNQNSNQEIDLDDIEIEVLVIAKNAKLFSQTASFLTRRGWATTVLSSMSQSIEFIAERKPDFVLISLNHPSPAIMKLPDLITGTFNLTCIAFAEQQDSASQNKLTKSKFKYKVQGQASGPTLHRTIRKILAEKLNINLEGSGSERAPTEKANREDGNDNITIKSSRDGAGGPVTIKGEGNTAGNGGVIIQKSSASLMQKPGAVKGEGGQEFEAADKEKEVLSTGKYTMAKANRRSLKQLTKASGEKEGDSAEAQAEKLAALKKSLFGEKKPEEAEAQDAVVAQGVGPGQELEAASGNPFTTGEMSATQDGPSAGAEPPKADGGGGISAAQLEAISEGLKAKGPETRNFQDYIPTPAATPQAGEAVESSDRSILERMVESTLEEICKPATLHTPVGNSTMRVGVFPVDSPDNPGYLVFATAMAERTAIPWFKDAEKALIKEFESAGVPGKFEPGFWVTVPEVNFGSWSEQQAKFSVTVNHEGIEITASFFPTGKPLPKIKDPSARGMVSLEVASVPVDQPVNFKAYLHMRKNKKFYLYLRNGRKLAPEQKQRLQEANVVDFHMKIVDKENIRMFLAASFLTDTIRVLTRKPQGEAA
jgi:hypothetical protein